MLSSFLVSQVPGEALTSIQTLLRPQPFGTPQRLMRALALADADDYNACWISMVMARVPFNPTDLPDLIKRYTIRRDGSWRGFGVDFCTTARPFASNEDLVERKRELMPNVELDGTTPLEGFPQYVQDSLWVYLHTRSPIPPCRKDYTLVKEIVFKPLIRRIRTDPVFSALETKAQEQHIDLTLALGT